MDLAKVLRSQDEVDADLVQGAPAADVEAEDAQVADDEVAEGMCVECGDQEADLRCQTCEEDFCTVCSGVVHRTGKRRAHKLDPLSSNGNGDVAMADAASVKQIGKGKVDGDSDPDSSSDEDEPELMPRSLDADQTERIKQRAKFIPLRLTADERHLLRLLEAALNVSEYTDKIDIISYTSKTKRIVAQLKHICAILSGLMVAQDFKAGQQLLEDRDYVANATFYQEIFEIGRRYKIMNPDRMRSTYGKMMYMIQDSLIPEVVETLGFDLFRPVLNVYDYLESRDGMKVLEDELILSATKEIIPEGKTRASIQAEIKLKERAIETICRKYSTGKLVKEQIRQALYSIGDNNAFLRANRDPVQKLRHLLFAHFSPTDPQPSIAIQAGLRGARLSHSHQKQFAYVNQSLTLWTLIMENMFELYALVDADLLSRRTRYRLMDTGQGFQRIQQCPACGRVMHRLLHEAQKMCGGWVGSSAIHLGDINVPNAFFLIDKYLQVPRILNPVHTTIQALPALQKDPFVSKYLDEAFGGIDALKVIILTDFFKHAFDGSGADNNFSAGSCIDGRLTSAWNWCNEVHRKPYYRALLLTDFPGFDGEGFNI